MYMGTMIINGCFLKRNNEGQNAMEQVQSTRRKKKSTKDSISHKILSKMKAK